MVVQLKVDSGKLTFDPPFRELRDILLRLLTDIVQNAEDLPRVSFLDTYSPFSDAVKVVVPYLLQTGIPCVFNIFCHTKIPKIKKVYTPILFLHHCRSQT